MNAFIGSFLDELAGSTRVSDCLYNFYKRNQMCNAVLCQLMAVSLKATYFSERLTLFHICLKPGINVIL